MRLQGAGEGMSHTALAVPFKRSARWPTSLCLAGPETAVVLVSPAVPAQELGVPAPSRR
jgi:hypothetical protein